MKYNLMKTDKYLYDNFYTQHSCAWPEVFSKAYSKHKINFIILELHEYRHVRVNEGTIFGVTKNV